MIKLSLELQLSLLNELCLFNKITVVNTLTFNKEAFLSTLFKENMSRLFIKVTLAQNMAHLW